MSEQSFEEKLTRLEKILKAVQSGETGLQDSVRLFEEGSALLTQLRGELEGAQARVKVLIEAGEEPLFDDFGEPGE